MWKFLEQKKFYGKSSNCLTCAKLCFDWHESMNRVWFLFFANFPIARKNIWMADWWPPPSFIHISCELLLVLHLQITDWIHQWAWFLQPRVWTGVRICSRGGEGCHGRSKRRGRTMQCRVKRRVVIMWLNMPPIWRSIAPPPSPPLNLQLDQAGNHNEDGPPFRCSI